MSHDVFLRRALELAREHGAAGINGPFGAVVVRDGEIVGEGWNRVVEGRDPTAHAEVNAIREAARRLGTHDLTGCAIYASCEPCPMCLSAIYWARIRTLFFAADKHDAAAIGFDDAHIDREIAQDWATREIRTTQTLHEEGKDVLEEWVRNPLRVEY
jgi:guanine deaminase